VRRGAAGPQIQCLGAVFLQREAAAMSWDRSPQAAKARPHRELPESRPFARDCNVGCHVRRVRGCHPLPLPVSRSWRRCAGGRGSAPGLAGWSCPHGPQRSHTAALGASSRPSSPPGSVGRARGGEHGLTNTPGVGWGTHPIMGIPPPPSTPA